MDIIIEPNQIYYNHSIFVKRNVNQISSDHIENIDNLFFSEGIKKKKLSIDKSIYIFSTKKPLSEAERVAEFNRKQNLLLTQMMFS
jgi:hypothetical protein